MIKNLVFQRSRLLSVLCLLVLASMILATASPTHAQTAETFTITFQGLGYDNYILHSPIDQVSYYFGLPADWLPQDGSYVDLHVNYQYTNVNQAEMSYVAIEVQLNDNVLLIQNLEQPGDYTFRVFLPANIIQKAEDPYINQLDVLFSAYGECREGVENDWLSATLTVYQTSILSLNYKNRPLTLDLSNYPKPIYQPGIFLPNQARFILPDSPSEADLQNAAVVAAKLGDLTNNNLRITASLASNTPQEALSNEHLFIFGQPENNPLIRQLELPLPLVMRELEIHSEMPAAVPAGQPFTVTLTVKNTSPGDRNLVVEDRWPAGASLKACKATCTGYGSNIYLWEVGLLEAGQEVSNDVQILLNPAVFVPGERVEHTASLLNVLGEPINVDTLAAQVSSNEQGEGGKVASSPETSQYFFSIDNQGVAEGNGIIQEIVSPWSPGRAVVVVSGSNDEAVSKASIALSSEANMPGISGSYAVVQATRAMTETQTQPAIMLPFSALGYEDASIYFFENKEYLFDVPYGWTLGMDTNMMFHFAHGSSLNNISASLEITLNDVLVGSIPLNEANVSSTWQSIPLPPKLIKGGTNRLNFQMSGNFDICIHNWFASGFWLTIYSDSFIRLPYQEKRTIIDLEILPQPFDSQSSLGNILIALPTNPTEAEISGALRLVSFLGNSAGGASITPQLTLAGEPDPDALSEQNIITVGRPTSNAYIAAANADLPQPFVPGTDTISQRVDNIVFELPSDVDLGYVQLLNSPWSNNHALLAITGTTDQGVAWALDALTNPSLQDSMSGNLTVLVKQGQLRSIDTREEPSLAEDTEGYYSGIIAMMTPKATESPATATPEVVQLSPTATTASEMTAAATPVPTTSDNPDSRPVWLIPVLLVSVLAVLGLVLIYMRQAKS